MDSVTEDLLNQRIQELVFDEDKTITCLSVANELNITLHDAKILLQQFVDDCHHLKQDQIHVTYLLSGSLKNGKQLGVYYVREDDLNENKCLFDVLTSQVVHSIQKSQYIDLNNIVLVDASHKLCKGSVVGKKCIKRTTNAKKLAVQPTTSEEREEGSFFKKLQIEKSNVESKEIKNVSQSQQKQSNLKQTSKGGTMNLFSNVPNKSSMETKVNDNDENNKKDNTKSSKLKQTSKGGIMNLFSNMPNKSNMETKVNKNDENSKKDTTKHSSEEVMDVDVKDVREKSHSKGSEKKRKKPAKGRESNKRRKRIQEICDSDSDIFEEEDNEDIIENSLEEPPVHVPPPTMPVKSRKRKAIDKTHMDEDGFIVTTTEYIYEDASDDEEKEIKVNTQNKGKVLLEKNPAKGETQNEVKSINNKGKKSKKVTNGKQPTLMNFFQKK